MSHACIGFSGGASGKKSAYQCRRCKRLEFELWRAWKPTPVFLPGESQGRGSLVGCTELDTTAAT